jgi:hypothetical protein
VELPHTDLAVGELDTCAPPCLSLYQPTHRHHPENAQDPIRFRNLVKTLETSLLQSVSAAEAAALLEPFAALAADHEFWTHSREGLAVLGGKDTFRVFKLQRPVTELAVVADTFHLKPLVLLRQTADRYQVLGINRSHVRLFEGNQYGLDEIELDIAVPRTMTDALGELVTESQQTVGSYGGVGGSSSGMHHGHIEKVEEKDLDAERFFRAVDRAIIEHYSKPSGLPLILATLPAHRRMFHELSHNSLLLSDGIDVHPDSISIDELRDRARKVVEPHYAAQLTKTIDEYGAARARELGHDDLGTVAAAIVAGRVGTLIVEADRVIAGRINARTGEIALADLSLPDVDDLLDDLTQMATKMGGRVVVVPADRMPTTTGIAATYRF